MVFSEDLLYCANTAYSKLVRRHAKGYRTHEPFGLPALSTWVRDLFGIFSVFCKIAGVVREIIVNSEY